MLCNLSLSSEALICDFFAPKVSTNSLTFVFIASISSSRPITALHPLIAHYDSQLMYPSSIPTPPPPPKKKVLKMQQLPDDIIATEILPKLPAKSLIRIKCVSKFFRTVISSPHFIKLHLQHGDNRRCLLLISRNDIYTMNMNMNSRRSRKPVKLPRLPLLNMAGSMNFGFVGSCNGLHCIGGQLSRTKYKYNYDYVVFNPCTGFYKHIILPDSITNPFRPAGFVYDDVNDDYKIVVVPPFLDDYHVVIYSVNSDCWRCSVDNGSTIKMWNNSKAAVLNNYLLHWISQDEHGGVSICCFNIRTEKWRAANMSFPYGIQHPNWNDIPYFGVVDGYLCVKLKDPENEQSHDLWIMKEYGVKDSWVKLIRGADNSCDVTVPSWWKPLSFFNNSRNDELLLWNDADVELIWYDIERQNIAKRKVVYVEGSQGFMCCESLVHIPGGKQLIRLPKPGFKTITKRIRIKALKVFLNMCYCYFGC